MRVEITRASPDRLPEIASLLGRTFVDEPMMRWPLGDHGDVEARYTQQFAWFLEGVVELGMVWEAGAAVGAAVWVPASQGDAWAEAQVEDTRMHTLTDDGGQRWDAFWDWVEGHMDDEPAWHLDSVGVDPAHRGRGIGGALIEFGLAKAEAAGEPACLETGNPRNVPYYERFGFRTVFDADSPDGGPHIWFMRRDP